jgi:ElaB/YqjD/DUF883 family membrane-anchored ribosome-binding protein
MEPSKSSTKSETRLNDRPIAAATDAEAMDRMVQREDIDKDSVLDQAGYDQLARDAKPTQSGSQSRAGTPDDEPMDILVQREDRGPDDLRDRSDVPRQAGSAKQQSYGQSGKDEMSKLRADLDDLVARIPGLSEMDLNAAKEKLLSSISSSRQTAMNYASEARQQINQRVEATGEYVKEKPMQSVGMAAGIGFLLGLLLSRR